MSTHRICGNCSIKPTRQHNRMEVDGVLAMGQSVLAYQFIAGLIIPLKSKLVGNSGTFDELLAKARFEEARIKSEQEPGGVSHSLAWPDPLSLKTGKGKARGSSSCH